MTKRYFRLALGVYFMLIGAACETSPKNQSLKKTEPIVWKRANWREVQRLSQKEGVSEALSVFRRYWANKDKNHQVRLGPYSFSAGAYVEAISSLQRQLGRAPLATLLSEHFELVEVQAHADQSLLLTGYYEPIIRASRVRNARFFQPLYAKPKNLVALDFREYSRTFPNWNLWESGNYPRRVRGRLNSHNKVVPFYSREDIDQRGMLEGEASVLAYVEPLDAFFLQIQGSGVLQFADGKVQSIGYSDQNGHKYYAIGRSLLEVIPRNKMSMQAIRGFLAGLEPREAYGFMSLNPSYVFFRKLKKRGLTSTNTEVIDEVTIASDPRAYPRGLFSILSRTVGSQLVVHQDTGGAIKGPYRADLFIGRGDEAERLAGTLTEEARLLVLIPRSRSDN